MSDLRARVREELAQLERVQAELAKIASRTDDERKIELIQLRRELAQQIARLGQAMEQYLEKSGDRELMREFRQYYSDMRSKAATHQANWPAVRLNQADEEYQRSARAVRDANKAFTTWIRAQIGG